jgi:hypothetical protein
MVEINTCPPTERGSSITLQAGYVRNLFANLENGRIDAFFGMDRHGHPSSGRNLPYEGRLSRAHLRSAEQAPQVGRSLTRHQPPRRQRHRCCGTAIALHGVGWEALRQYVLLDSLLLERNYREGQGLPGLGARTAVDRRKRAPTFYDVFRSLRDDSLLRRFAMIPTGATSLLGMPRSAASTIFVPTSSKQAFMPSQVALAQSHCKAP